MDLKINTGKVQGAVTEIANQIQSMKGCVAESANRHDALSTQN